MEVKVTCPKCGESFSQPPARVVRKVKCQSCSHSFVPVREGVPCPTCGTVLILPEGQSKRTVKCLNCSFAFREPKWWQKRKFYIPAVITAVVLVLVVFMLCRWRSNVALAKELRAEFEAWLQTLPKVPDSENGMLVILEAHDDLPDQLPARFSKEDFSVENEPDAALLREWLSKNEGVLQKIREGLQYKRFMVPVDYSKLCWGEFSRPPIHKLQHAATLLALKGELAESGGRKSEALNEYINVLRLGRTLWEDRMLVSRMVGVVILRTGLRPLTETLSKSSFEEKELAYALEEMIKLHEGDYFSVMELEYYSWLMLLKEMIEGTFYEKRSDMYSPNLWQRIRVSKYVYNYRHDVEVYRKVLKIWRKVEPVRYHALPLEAKDHDALLKKVGAPLDDTWGFSFLLLIPALERGVTTLAGVETVHIGAIAMAGIRLFEAKNGRLPKNLAELGELVPKELLTDPFSGNNLVYRLAGDNFFLYSVGLDGVDGNPTDAPPYFEEDKSLSDMPDIIFHAPRQEK